MTDEPLGVRTAGISRLGKRDLFQTRAMYFAYYLAAGAYIPFINLHFERIGLIGLQIGILAALPVFINSFAALVWGGLADAFHIHRSLLRTALLLAPMAVLLLSRAMEFDHLIVFVAVVAFVSSPIIPLMDSAAVEIATTNGRSYGNLRVWGAVGWSLSTWFIGTLIQSVGIRVLFYGYAAFMFATFLLSWLQGPRSQVLRSPWRYSVKQVLLRRGFLIFLFSIFLLALASSAANGFMSLYMNHMGASEGMIGLAWTISALSEIPVMLSSGAIMRKINPGGLLVIAFSAYAVRWLLFSFVRQPAWVLAVQLLHGLSFAAFLVGGVTYVSQRMPEGLGTTGQAIFTAVTYGLASIAGSIVGGFLYDHVAMDTFFRILAISAALGLAIFLLSTRNDSPDIGLPKPAKPEMGVR